MKFQKIILAMTLCLLLFPSTVSAAEDTKDGIEVLVTAGKEEYSEDESADVQVTLTNTNAWSVQNVTVEGVLPERLDFVQEDQKAQTIDEIAPGESAVVNFQINRPEASLTDFEQPEGNTDDEQKETVAQDDTGNDLSDTGSDASEMDKPVETGDFDNAGVWFLAMLIAFAVILGLLAAGKKNRKRFLSMLLCISLGSTLLNGMNAKAAEPAANKRFSVYEQLKFGDSEYDIAFNVTFDTDENTAVDKVFDDAINTLFPKDGSEEVNLDTANGKFPVTDVKVDYTLKDGNGFVTVTDASDISYLSRTAGAMSAPVDISVFEDEIVSAAITFRYDPDRLGNVSPENLKIAWYDNENDKVVILDDSVVDTQAHTVSVPTTHFSEYIVVDTNAWYDIWEIEQLVIRDQSGASTPYYNIVFTLDSSSSMGGSKATLTKEATKEFIRQLQPEDMVSVMDFGSSADVQIANTILKNTSIESIEEQIDAISIGGGTNYQDGLNTALSLVLAGRDLEDQETQQNPNESAISRQSLLIFLSDGAPTTDYTQDTLDQLKYLAETVNCRAVTIGIGSGAQDRYLQEIAQAGNGQYFKVTDVSELANVFDTINGWYVGSSKDSDGDGLPDIVETTGMRTQYGEFYRTDPASVDTDGDGISDGEEIGEFVFVEDGGSYFKINSNPTVPTYQSSESKLRVEKIGIKLKKPTYTQIINRNYEELYTLFQDYEAVCSGRSVHLELAPDGLSETMYQGAKPILTIRFSAPCVEKKEIGVLIAPMEAGDTFSKTVDCKCHNNLLNCNEDHNSVTFSIDNESGTVDSSNTERLTLDNNSIRQSWTDVLEQKLLADKNSYREAEQKMTEKSESILDSAIRAKDTGINDSIDMINSAVRTTIVIDANIPKDIEEAYYNCFTEHIEDKLLDEPESYSNVKTAADLIKKVYRELETSDDVIEFTTAKNTNCILEYTKFPSSGAAYFEGYITNKDTGRRYKFGGTSVNTKYINGYMQNLKEYADMKIEEAKEEIFAAGADMLNLNKLKSFLQKGIKDQIFETLSEASPNLSRRAEDLVNAIEKFKDLKSKFDKVSDIDLSDVDYDQLVDRVDQYNAALLDWYNSIASL